MRIGDHPSLQPISARSFLPVSSGLFVLPNAGLRPSQLVASSLHVAQVSAVERVQAKADLHDKLFAAREGIAQVAAGFIGEEAVRKASQTFNAYVDALDRGNSNDRKKADELRTALQGVRTQVTPTGVDIVAGRLAPDEPAISHTREGAPEAVAGAFIVMRDRLDPVFAAQSESIAVEAETAQARIPVAQTTASVGATIAGLSLRGASLTQILGRVGAAGNKQATQAQKIQRLVGLTLPKPTIPGTILPGLPALGRPVGIAGPEYEINRRTPGIAPGRATVSETPRKGGVPVFEAPAPVELKQPGNTGGPPGQRADVSEAVKAFEQKKRGHESGERVKLPQAGEIRRVDSEGKARPAKPSLRPQPRPAQRVPGPEPRDKKDRKDVPDLPAPTQESVPVAKRDDIPKNPGKPLKDLIPPNPLPPPGGKGDDDDNGNGNGNGNNAGGFDMPAPPPGG